MVKVGSDFWRSSRPTYPLTQGPLEPAPQDHVQVAFQYLQGWRLHNLSGQPVPGLSHPHSEKAFPDVQTEPPVFQFVLTASGPGTGHHWKEPGSIFLIPSHPILIYMDEIPLCLLFSRLNSPSSLSLSPWEEMLLSLNHLNCPFLDSLQYIHVSLVLESPDLDTALTSAGSPPSTTGNAPPNAAQDTIHLLCRKGTWLVHIQPGVHQDPQVLLCQAAFQLGGPQPVLVLGVVPSQGQGFALSLVELLGALVSPLLQPVKVPLGAAWCTMVYQLLLPVLCHQRLIN